MLLRLLPPDGPPPDPCPSDDPPHAWVLVVGDPVHGFAFYGPFRSREDAEAAQADDTINLRRWSWVAELRGVRE